ncbi:hypothetical protein ACI2IX_19355 [Leifsonia aquatica]|uniref:hypothetical protein n=1 Tax=Leifsonia aquatica TaxID=144185 RepID=UPI0038510821
MTADSLAARMRSRLLGVRAVVAAGWAVARRPQWMLPLAVVGLCALTSASASIAALMLACVLMLACLAIALHALGVNPFSPLSVLRATFARRTWTQLLIAGGMALLAFGIFRLSEFVTWLANLLAHATSGDANLVSALLIAILALFVCIAVCVLTGAGARVLERDQSEGAAANLAYFRQARAYWGEAGFTLLLVVVALVPAALLANWAWNVLASVFLPLFVLSVRSAVAERDPSESISTRARP